MLGLPGRSSLSSSVTTRTPRFVDCSLPPRTGERFCNYPGTKCHAAEPWTCQDSPGSTGGEDSGHANPGERQAGPLAGRSKNGSRSVVRRLESSGRRLMHGEVVAGSRLACAQDKTWNIGLLQSETRAGDSGEDPVEEVKRVGVQVRGEVSRSRAKGLG
ncbi:hypothetical protein NDU88_006720 [Pleurodeles waltl]|uniref:Uncharacterized protein n=1 Tax=Pleurodeles waltl TaxID=8319 RepID=A0AAV7ULU1_PLEWA|nr:hypothetical protein NDU88_006720 [Pleurodeles waltl]